MNCIKKIGYGCFNVACIRNKKCKEADANYKVTVTIQKTYNVYAESAQEALNIVAGNVRPLPDKTELVNTKVKQL